MSIWHYSLKKVGRARRNWNCFFKSTSVLYDICGEFQDFAILGKYAE